MKLSKTDKNKLSKIAVSLEHGPLNLVKRRVFYVCLAISIFIPLIIIFAIMMAYVAGSPWDGDMTLGVVMGVIFGLIFFIPLLIAYLFENKLTKQVLLWLCDAVELKARAGAAGEYGKQKSGVDGEDVATAVVIAIDAAIAIATGTDGTGAGVGVSESESFKVKLKVSFKYDNKQIKKVSGKSDYLPAEPKYNTKAGYSTHYAKYLGKEIDIVFLFFVTLDSTIPTALSPCH